MNLRKLSLIVAILFCVSLMFASRAAAFILPDPSSYLVYLGTPGAPAALPYGDFYSYSLPILALNWSYEHYGNGNHVGPGNPFYVNSSAGHIMNDIVIGTGASGTNVNDNPAGMDDAFNTNTSATTWSSVTATEPGGAGEFAGDQAGTWDTSLTSLLDYLGRNDSDPNNDSPLVFFWNNNEEGKGGDYTPSQDLYGWARVTIADSADPSTAIHFFVRDPFSTSPYYPPGADDWALSPGRVCLDGNTGAKIDCSSAGPNDHVINHNLGANQAVFALYNPVLDLNLEAWLLAGFDVMQIDFRLIDIDNGYEQLFIQRIGGLWYTPIPEPASLVFLGSGLLGLAAFRRKRKRA